MQDPRKIHHLCLDRHMPGSGDFHNWKDYKGRFEAIYLSPAHGAMEIEGAVQAGSSHTEIIVINSGAQRYICPAIR